MSGDYYIVHKSDGKWCVDPWNYAITYFNRGNKFLTFEQLDQAQACAQALNEVVLRCLPEPDCETIWLVNLGHGFCKSFYVKEDAERLAEALGCGSEVKEYRSV